MEDQSGSGLLDQGLAGGANRLPMGVDEEARSEFIDIAAHELRGLITVIYTGSHLLRSSIEVDEDSRNEILDDIEQATEKLQRDVDGLTMLARMGLIAPRPDTVRLQEIVPRVIAKFKDRRRCREVNVRLDDNLPALSLVPGYVDLSLRNVLAAVDEVALAERPLEVHLAPAMGEALLAVSGVVEPTLPAQLVAAAFSGENTPAAQRRRIAPIITRLLVASQNGRLWGLLLEEEDKLEVTIGWPLSDPGKSAS